LVLLRTQKQFAEFAGAGGTISRLVKSMGFWSCCGMKNTHPAVSSKFPKLITQKPIFVDEFVVDFDRFLISASPTICIVCGKFLDKNLFQGGRKIYA